jgi:hypothetical protein
LPLDPTRSPTAIQHAPDPDFTGMEIIINPIGEPAGKQTMVAVNLTMDACIEAKGLNV